MQFKKVFKKYNITQVELAKRLGINKVSLNAMINANNDIRVSTLQKIANAVGCDITEFFEPSESLDAMIEYQGRIYRATSLRELKDLVSSWGG